ncbi:Pectinesterase inhibitor domain [Dillenia turbinata]|uniref:Pectinesterase inhibitor domain n=1 Tax=Dillenia turbinata TaxID=194707 RepID=A0AAN8UVS0_9MAGN
MVSISSLILALVVLTAQQQNNFLAEADEGLIEKACHNADAPATCKQCLDSDSRSQQANTLGDIAVILLDCVNSHSTNLAHNLTQLASEATEESSRQRYKNCAMNFTDAQGEMQEARKGIQGTKYDDAEECVDMALQHGIMCITSIKSLPTVPQEVVFEIALFEELCEASMRVIERL